VVCKRGPSGRDLLSGSGTTRAQANIAGDLAITKTTLE